jgi:hypothetical protein
MTRARTGWLALVPLMVGLAACQQPGQPGPMERAGAQIDRTVAGVQRSVGEFSQRAGQEVDHAGQSVGATAQQLGTGLHDRLVPADAPGAPSTPQAEDGAPRPGP